ncbi:MAG: histidine phosphatase family protein [Anaerolineae bacterium]
MTELLLIRHGQATHNVEGRWEGRGPSPLTPLGEQQAEALGARLAAPPFHIDRLYASSIRRAVQTAQRIGQHLSLQPTIRGELGEIDFGQVNGLNMDSFRETMPEQFEHWQDRHDLSFEFPGGEQRQAFFHRVAQALDQIVAQHPEGQVAVVTHGGTIRAGLAHLFPKTMSDWWAYELHNGSLTHAIVSDHQKRLLALNDRQHLGEE